MKTSYKYVSTEKIIKTAPKMNRLVPSVLHRGTSGKKSGMWKATRSLFGMLTKKLPRRFPEDMGIREFRQVIKEELVSA